MNPNTEYTKRDWDSHPPYIVPDYKSTLLRGPSIVFRLLATLLVIWTILLALPTSAHFFPSRAWQWGWVGFDVVLGVALFTLAHRWRQIKAYWKLYPFSH